MVEELKTGQRFSSHFLAVDVDIFVEATYSAKWEGPEILYKKFNIHMTECIIKNNL